MTTKEKARNGGDAFAQKELTRSGANRTTGQRGTTSNRDSIPLDPLQSWFNLAKPSRNRQQKREWKRGARK